MVGVVGSSPIAPTSFGVYGSKKAARRAAFFVSSLAAMTSSHTTIRAVILDLDGTLADTAIEIGLALNETLAELGVPVVSLEAATALIGRGVRSLVERALAEAGGVTDVDRAVDLFEGHYARIVGTRATLFPGVEEGLVVLRDAGLGLAVVTNKPRAFAQKLLESLG